MERAINGMTQKELEGLFTDLGQPSFRASQLFHGLHEKGLKSPDEVTTLPKSLREALRTYPFRTVEEVRQLLSQDGSRKILYALEDGNTVETVYMPYPDRTTLCISSQVGCKMGCQFCASTKAAFVRNLQAEEMLSQVYVTEEITGDRIDRIVLMGIGEPLDNYDEVVRFLRLITDPRGKNLSARSITLSTCGLVPRIYDLVEEGIPLNLAISLHASSDEDRRRTMPIANRYSIREIIQACLAYFEKTGRRISLEYVLIEGENDRLQDLDALSRLFKGPMWHINLLPLNPIKEYKGKSSREERIYAFEDALHKRGIHASVRKKRGEDIDGACGQLRILYQRMGGPS